MSIKRVLAAFSLSAILAGTAFAQAKGKSPVLMSHFTPNGLVKALTELGATDATVRKTPMGGGQNVDVVYFSNGTLKHVGILTACNPKGCLGLQLMTIWGDNAGKNASRIALNKYNSDFGFGKGFIGSSNTLVYSRYTIADGGISVDNLKANVSNFAAGSIAFMQYMAKSGSTIDASVKPDDAGSIHAVAHNLAPEAEAVLMEIGQGTGLNALTIQSSPVPDAPALVKPAQ